MNWNDIDRMFHRAFRFCFSKKKLLFTYPLVASCGIFINLFRILSIGAGDWVKLSLGFFPIFVTASLLLSAGIVLTRAYHNEVKGVAFSFRDLSKKSWNLMVAAAYLTLPLSMSYVMLWTVIGFFYVLKEIPIVGVLMSLLLSFVPFLLVLSIIVLILVNVLVLFFVTPAIALRSECSLDLFLRVARSIKERVLTHVALLALALISVSAVLGVLYLAGHVTASTYMIGEGILPKLAQSLVTSLAFSALCTPLVIFFFNFAAESYVLLRRSVGASSI